MAGRHPTERCEAHKGAHRGKGQVQGPLKKGGKEKDQELQLDDEFDSVST